MHVVTTNLALSLVELGQLKELDLFILSQVIHRSSLPFDSQYLKAVYSGYCESLKRLQDLDLIKLEYNYSTDFSRSKIYGITTKLFNSIPKGLTLHEIKGKIANRIEKKISSVWDKLHNLRHNKFISAQKENLEALGLPSRSCFIGRKDNRFYCPSQNLQKETRDQLFLEKRMIYLDRRSSQLYILFDVLKKTKITQTEINKFKDYLDKDVYLSLVPGLERATAKKQLLLMIFHNTYIPTEVTKAFKKEFPSIFYWLQNQKQKRGHKHFAHMLARKESKLMRLLSEDLLSSKIPHMLVHDGIYIPYHLRYQIEQTMNDICSKLNMTNSLICKTQYSDLKPHLKTKNNFNECRFF